MAAAAGGPQSFENPTKAPKKKRLRKKHVDKMERQLLDSIDLNTTSNGQEERKDLLHLKSGNITKITKN